MPLATESQVLGINDAKIFPITADTSIALTYGTAVDVPGITALKVDPKFIEKQLKGDEVIKNIYSKLEQVEWAIEHGIISLAALAIMVGGTVVAAGETPSQTQTYTLTGDDLPQYFKLEGKVDYTDIGDVHLVLYKCKCTSFSYSLKGEDYATVSASGKAIPTVKDGKVKDIVFNETAADIVTV